MSIRIYNGRWLLNGAGLATGDDCCCDEPPVGDQDKYPCDCFTLWPPSLTMSITGMEDYFISGQGLCNCPADYYGAGFNQTVVLDFAGVITFDGCSSLPVSGGGRARTYAAGGSVVVYPDFEPQGVAVYRGSLTNGSCDEYGVEVLLNAFGGQCAVAAVLDRLATGAPTICEPWVEANLVCNHWVFYGQFDTPCSSADLYVGQSYFGGDSTFGGVSAGLT